MKRYRGLWLACIAALCAGGAARADLIATPDGFGDGWALANWYVDCDYEYLCGNDVITLGNTASTSNGIDEVIVTGPSGENFAYTETDNLYGRTINGTLTNLGSVAGPLTVTFATFAAPAVEGFGTTLYSHDGDFTATVSAYDAAGNLLGTTISSSAPNDPNAPYLACEFYNSPCYSAFVGIQDLSAGYATIASVVISTVATVEFGDGPDTLYDDFDLGQVGAYGPGAVPEPGTFALMSLAFAGILTARLLWGGPPGPRRTPSSGTFTAVSRPRVKPDRLCESALPRR